MKLKKLIALVVVAQMIPVIVALAREDWLALVYVAVAVFGGWTLGLLAAFWLFENT